MKMKVLRMLATGKREGGRQWKVTIICSSNINTVCVPIAMYMFPYAQS